jgi:hypothetical protein
MSLEGRIAIDVGFTDSGSSTGVQSVKRIALTSTDAYTAGKVVVAAGTMTTAGAQIDFSPSTFRDASGSLVSLASVSRYAFACSRRARILDGSSSMTVVSDADRVAVCEAGNTAATLVSLSPLFTSGTASYSLVVYGT